MYNLLNAVDSIGNNNFRLVVSDHDSHREYQKSFITERIVNYDERKV